MNHLHLKFFLSLLLASGGVLHAQQESSEEPSNSLSFSVDKCLATGPNAFYFGLNGSGGKQFAFAQFMHKIIIGLAPETVTLDYVEDQPNPFFDKHITRFQLLENHPLLTIEGEPDVLYYAMNFELSERPMSVLSAKGICDAQEPTTADVNHTTSGINGLSVVYTGTSGSIERYVVAGVNSHEGQWGQPGSGLALIKVDSYEVPVENKPEQSNDEEDENPQVIKRFFLNILDAKTGQSKGNKPFALDASAQENPLNINDGLGALQSGEVDMYWDDLFRRLYVPLQIKTKDDAQADQGACALLVGRIVENKLYLEPIVSAQALDHTADNIVAALGPGKSVCLHKVRIMHTSTGLDYLIVMGGCGEMEETKMLMHAFPLINKDTGQAKADELLKDLAHGVIAKKQGMPTVSFLRGRYGRFRGRTIDESPTSVDEFYMQQERAVQIGTGVPLPNTIDQMVIGRDTVHVLIKKDGNGQRAGVFSSQAIFNEQGLIAAWSPWQRSAYTDGTVKGITDILDVHKYALCFIEQDEQGVIKMRETGWDHEQTEDEESQTLERCLHDELPSVNGGIQGLYDFDYQTPGLYTDQQAVSLLVATGNKKVVLAQTGATNKDGLFTSHDTFTRAILLDGSLKNLTPVTMLSMSGGVLDELGPITCATVASSDRQSWLLVGGVNGLALLAHNDGTGWSRHEGLQPEFAGLDRSMAFKKIGNYNSVKKIIHDDQFLYVLTRDRLERFLLSEEWYKTKPTVLATSEEFATKFTDVIISGPFALLGSTAGLLRVGVTGDVLQATNSTEVNWQPISLPTGTQYTVSLYAVCPTGKETGFAYDGQVYVLSGSPSSNDSHVFRFFIKDVSIYGITDETVQLIPDYGYRDHKSSFISFGGYRNNFATDGLIHLSTRGGRAPMLHVLPAFVGGKLIPSSRGYRAPVPWTGKNEIRPIVKNSATGSWLIAGDFGVCTYQ